MKRLFYFAFVAALVVSVSCSGKSPTSPTPPAQPSQVSFPSGSIVYHRVSVERPDLVDKYKSLVIQQVEGTKRTTLMTAALVATNDPDTWTCLETVRLTSGGQYRIYATDPARVTDVSGSWVAKEIRLNNSTVNRFEYEKDLFSGSNLEIGLFTLLDAEGNIK